MPGYCLCCGKRLTRFGGKVTLRKWCGRTCKERWVAMSWKEESRKRIEEIKSGKSPEARQAMREIIEALKQGQQEPQCGWPEPKKTT